MPIAMHCTTYQEQLNDHLQNVSLTNNTNPSKLALNTLCPSFFYCNPYSADRNCVQTRVESTRQCICRSLSTKSRTMQKPSSLSSGMAVKSHNLYVVEWNFFRTLILSSLFHILHNTIIVLVDLLHHSNPQTDLAC